MGRKRILLLAVLVFCLASCSKEETPAPQPEVVPVAAQPVERPERRVIVYPDAEIDYLGNVYNFSWEQKNPPEMVVLHFCSGVMANPNDPYDLQAVRQTFIDADVSVHYLVGRDGTIYCYIPENRTAWHAGPGRWKDIEKYENNLNHYSIGIEIMAIGTAEEMSIYMTQEEYDALDPAFIGYTDAQYDALKDLVEDICRRNNIPLDRDHVIGHEEYAPQKNDPGDLFDWERLIP